VAGHNICRHNKPSRRDAYLQSYILQRKDPKVVQASIYIRLQAGSRHFVVWLIVFILCYQAFRKFQGFYVSSGLIVLGHGYFSNKYI
jgi:hypothetical protein